MSKLSDRIRDARRHGGRAFGFSGAVGGSVEAARGLLVAAAGSSLNGADVLIVSADHAQLGAVDALIHAVAESGADPPVGVEPEMLTAASVSAAEEAGATFVVFRPESATADALLSEKLEYALRLSPDSREPGTLRAIGSLQPTLVIADAVADPLPVTALLRLRQVGMSVGAPLGVTVPPHASSAMLEALRDSGVAMLILSEPTSEHVETLRARIAEVPARARRRAAAATAILPSFTVAPEEDDFD